MSLSVVVRCDRSGPYGCCAAELHSGAAAARETTALDIATRWRELAHQIGDALDELPPPTTT